MASLFKKTFSTVVKISAAGATRVDMLVENQFLDIFRQYSWRGGAERMNTCFVIFSSCIFLAMPDG